MNAFTNMSKSFIHNNNTKTSMMSHQRKSRFLPNRFDTSQRPRFINEIKPHVNKAYKQTSTSRSEFRKKNKNYKRLFFYPKPRKAEDL